MSRESDTQTVSPADLFRAVADVRAGRREPAAVADDLLVRLDDPVHEDAVLSALKRLLAAAPEQTPRVVRGVGETVVDGLEPPNEVYYEDRTTWLCAVVESHPAAAEAMTETIRAVSEAVSFAEEDLFEALAAVAPAEPAVVVDLFDLLLDRELSYDDADTFAHVAVARAARVAPDRFERRAEELVHVVESPGTAPPERSDDALDPVSAARALGRLGITQPSLLVDAVPSLVEAARDEPAVRRAAIEALGRIAGVERIGGRVLGYAAERPAETVDVACTHADDPEPAVRREVVRTLERVGRVDPEIALGRRAVLFDAFDDPDSDVREAALSAVETVYDAATDESVRRAVDVVPALLSSEALDVDLGHWRFRRALVAAGPGALDRTTELRELLLSVAFVDFDDARREGRSGDPRRGAIEVIGELLEPSTRSPGQLLAALAAGTTAADDSVRDAAFEAIGAAGYTDEVVAEPLLDALRSGPARDPAAEAVRDLGDRRLVDRAVALLAEELAALDDSDPPSAVPETARDDELEHASLLAALQTVVENAPTSVVPHLETVVAAMAVDDSSARSEGATTIEAVARVAPDTLEPVRPALRVLLAATDDAAVEAKLLSALASCGDPDRETVATSLERADVRTHVVGRLPTIAAEWPALSFTLFARLLANVPTSQWDAELCGTVDGLGDLAALDVRYRQPAVDALGSVLEKRDSWIRWDGARELAAVGAVDPAAIARLGEPLARLSWDTNDTVVTHAATALRRIGSGAAADALADLRTHPLVAYRDRGDVAAADSHDEIVSPSSRPAGYRRGDGRRWRVDPPVASRLEAVARSGREPRHLGAELDERLADDRDRTRVTAALLGFVRRSDPTTRSRAATALTALYGASSVDPPALAPIVALEDSNPRRRALAAYTLGETLGDHDSASATDRAAERLVELVDDDRAVRQFATRSLGLLGETRPAAGARAVAPLVDYVARATGREQAVPVRALRRIGEANPDALVEDADAERTADRLVSALASVDSLCRETVIETLWLLPPAAVAATDDVVERLLAVLDDELQGTSRAMALLGLVAETDPRTVAPKLERVVEDGLGYAGGKRAVAAVASVAPDRVAAVADELQSDRGSPAIRRALALSRSPEYVDQLAVDLAADPTILDAERSLVVDYVLAVDDPDRREAVLAECAERRPGVEARVGRLVDAFAARLDDDAASRRRHAAAAIRTLVESVPGGLDHVDAVSAVLDRLLAATDADEWSVRSSAIEAVTAVLFARESLADGMAAGLVSTVLDSLGDEQAWVRRHASDALAALPSRVRREERVLDRVVEGVDAASIHRRRGSVLAVGTVVAASEPTAQRLERAIDCLLEATEAADVWVRRNAFESLTALASATDGKLSAHDRVATAARGGLADDNPTVRAEACRCLGHVGDESDRRTLAALTDPMSRVRDAAAAAADRLADRPE